MIEVRILIPAASNDGDVFTGAHHRQFERYACELFGGITREPATAEGVWLNDDLVEFRDVTFIYVVALSSITEAGRIGELAEYAKAHYGQKAIYVRYLGLAEIL